MPQLGRRLLEGVQPGPGDCILDMGTGYGEPGLTAARAVAPRGRVILQDLSGEMLALARQRADDADLGDVEVEIVEGEADELALPTGSLDAVISRSVLMYLADPAGSLTRLRAALRPGGRLAANTWAGPEDVAMASPSRSSDDCSTCRRRTTPACSPWPTRSDCTRWWQPPASRTWSWARSPSCSSSPLPQRRPASYVTVRHR